MNSLRNTSLLKNLRPGPGRVMLPYLAALLFIWNTTYTPLHVASDHHLPVLELARVDDNTVVMAGTSDTDSNAGAKSTTDPFRASKQGSHSTYDHLGAIFAFAPAIVPAISSEFEIAWLPSADANQIHELQLRLTGARAPPVMS